jgi:hypothetical protein
MKKIPKTNKEIFKAIMKAKSAIDAIAEEKNLDASHDLCLASDRLDLVLNAFGEQGMDK